jgi:hypothetical protein
MEQVTGAPLDPSIFLAYLKDKYTPLYKLWAIYILFGTRFHILMARFSNTDFVF